MKERMVDRKPFGQRLGDVASKAALGVFDGLDRLDRAKERVLEKTLGRGMDALIDRIRATYRIEKPIGSIDRESTRKLASKK